MSPLASPFWELVFARLQWNRRGFVMMDARPQSLSEQAHFSLDSCVVFVLLWLASSDGANDPAANRVLQDYIDGVHDESVDLHTLLSLIYRNDEAAFLEIFERLRADLDAEGRQFLLELSIRVATARSPLSTPANFILRFLGDLFDLDLANTYNDVAGQGLPAPGDPSSVEWWQVQDERGKRHTWRGVHEDSLSINRAEALAILGLEHDADVREIKMAYRRLVHQHHPDKFSTDEERYQQQQEFLRVRRAYEVLKS